MNTSTKQLSEIIAKAINDEPFLNKETLIPKINALIKGFRLTLDISNYNKQLSEKDQVNLHMQLRIKDMETNFWKHRLQNTIGKENMQKYYDELDVFRETYGIQKALPKSKNTNS